MSRLPDAFCDNMRAMLGDEAEAFFAALNEAPASALRINPQRGGAGESAARDFIQEPVPWSKNGYYIADGARPGAAIAHAAGAYYIQEASAMVSAEILNAHSGEYILDLCAAPGGKATQNLAGLCGRGLLVANEPEGSRAKVLAANLERMGARNAIVTNAYPDALARCWAGFFDAVQCDAPCSGEGMFRRDIASRDEWSAGAPEGCARRQAEILDRAAELVRPGGRIVYSTCTFNSIENEGTIRAFLARHPDFHTEDFALRGIGNSEGGMIRVYPHRVRGDGHFACLLRKEGGLSRDAARQEKISPEDARLIDRLNEICDVRELIADKKIIRVGEYMFARPAALPEGRVKIAAHGLCLMRVGKNYIEPAHGLAMAADIESVRQRYELSDEQAVRYLGGEAIECDSAGGWTIALWRGLPLGWGKVNGGMMKNHLPKGLRLSLHGQG